MNWRFFFSETEWLSMKRENFKAFFLYIKNDDDCFLLDYFWIKLFHVAEFNRRVEFRFKNYLFDLDFKHRIFTIILWIFFSSFQNVSFKIFNFSEASLRYVTNLIMNNKYITLYNISKNTSILGTNCGIN